MDWERLAPRCSALARMPECIDNRRVLIWGTGSGGIRTHQMLKTVGIEVAGFVDNSRRLMLSWDCRYRDQSSR